jgi:hypothetical protein
MPLEMNGGTKAGLAQLELVGCSAIGRDSAGPIGGRRRRRRRRRSRRRRRRRRRR